MLSKLIVFLSIVTIFLQIQMYNTLVANELEMSKQFDLNDISMHGRRRCPECDESVFDYCSEKLFHDSCCCNNPNNPYYPLPRECRHANCNFLHANSCPEHKLITACCCTDRQNFFNRK